MSDITARAADRPLPRPLPPLRAGQRRAQAREGARVGGRRGRRRPRGRGRPGRRRRPPASVVAEGCAAAADGPARLVRVNAVGTPWHAGDMAAARASDVDALVLPKASPEAVDALGPDGPPVVAIVETAQGLRLAYEIGVAAARRRAACSARSTSAPRSGSSRGRTGSRSSMSRSKVVARLGGGRTARRRSTSCTSTSATRRGSRRSAGSPARSASAARPASIPAQVRDVNRVFAPSEAEIAWARGSSRRYERRRREPRRARRRRGDGRPAGRRARAADPRGSGRSSDGSDAAPHRRSGEGRFYEDFDGRRRLPQPARPHGHRDRQHLVHVPDAEHEPGALQRALRGARRSSASRS